MKTVILAGTVAQELSLLTEDLPTGALYLGPQPLSVYAIKQLEILKSNIFVQSGQNYNGLIHCIAPFLSWQTSINELAILDQTQVEEVLWLRDDVLYNLEFSDLVIHLRQVKSPYVAVFVDQIPVMFYKNKVAASLPEFSQHMSTLDYCNEMMNAAEWQSIHLSKDQAIVIDSPKKFYQVAMALLCGEYQRVEFDPHQNDKKIILGWHTEVNKSSLSQNYAYLGDCVRIHKEAQLKGNIIICNGCYVDEYADIENTIVMPNIYIGSYLDLKNAIVTSTAIIRIDTGVIIPIEEKKFIKKLVA